VVRGRAGRPPEGKVTEIVATTMTGAELRAAREMMGLSPTWMATWLRTDERNLERMERGAEPIHDKFAQRMDQLVDHTDALVDRLTAQARTKLDALEPDDPGPVLWTFKTDRDYESWANRTARHLMKQELPPRQSEDVYEEVRLRSMSLLMAGCPTTEVAEDIRRAVLKLPTGGRVADFSQMPQFPATLPARWHRQVCARVAERVPEVAIAYVE
jgi:hypothetical protein